MEYNKLTAEIKGYEDEFSAKVAEAKKAYDELIEKYFYSMRDKIVEVVKDIPDEEFDIWLRKARKAQKDKDISGKLFMLVQVSWAEAHKDEKEDKAIPQETFKDVTMDLMALGLLRRLL